MADFDYPGLGIRRHIENVYLDVAPGLPDHREIHFTFLHLADAPDAATRFDQLGEVIQAYYRNAPIGNYALRFYSLDNEAPPLRNTSLRNLQDLDLGAFIINFFQRMIHSGSVAQLVGFTVVVRNVGPHIPYLNAGGWGPVLGWRALPPHLKHQGLCEHPHITQLDEAERASWCGFRAITLGWWAQSGPDVELESVHHLQQQAKAIALAIGRSDGFMRIVDISPILSVVNELERYRIVVFNAWRKIQYADQGEQWFWSNDVERTDADPFTIHLYWDHLGKHFYWIQSTKKFFNKYNCVNEEYLRCLACFHNINRAALSTHSCTGTGRFQCTICLQPFGCAEALQTHTSQQNTQYPQCEVCERTTFNGESCFTYHLDHNCHPVGFLPPRVEKVKCTVCGWNYRSDRDHNCIGEHGCCRYCKIRFDYPHQRDFHRCEIVRNDKVWTPLETKEKNGRVTSFTWRSHYFYDFETTKTTPLSNNSYQLAVMAWCIRLIIPDRQTAAFIQKEEICQQLSQRVDSLLLDDVRVEGIYRDDGIHSIRFLGKHMHSFITVIEKALTNASYTKRWVPTLWAHNGSKFDAKFIFDYYVNEVRLDLAGVTYSYEFGENGEPMLDEKGDYIWKPPKALRHKNQKEVIRLSNVGSRILSMKVLRSTFRCSHAHHAMPLRNLPKVFGLSHQVRKGEFPYSRLSPDRWNDRPLSTGMPPLQEFETESMSASRRRDVIRWWIDECVRRWAKPDFVRACLAAVLLPDEPPLGLPADYDERYRIKKGRKSPAQIVRGWKFADELWAYLKDDVDVGALCLEAYHRAAEEMHERIWEVTANVLLKADKAIISPLDCSTAPAWAHRLYTTWFMPGNALLILQYHEHRFVRKALRGGRTDKRANWIEITPERKAAGDRLVYVDFKSLYPSVQKCDAHSDFPTHFPVGTPEYHMWTNRTLDNAELIRFVGNLTGFLKVTTRPKRYVTHPTLHRLRKLSADEQAGLTDPDDSEKLVFANEPISQETYAWPELLEAIESDEIEVEELHESMLFDKGHNVFDQYVNFFFALKENAEQTGNKGLRALAKLMLNSLWGKLGQRNYPIREWVSCHERLDYIWKKFETGHFELVNFHEKEPTRAWIEYIIKDDVNNHASTAPHVAAFVSTWGRVMLHRKLLRQHGQRALYCDTDSAIVYLRAGDELPFTGKDLGCLTMEVPKILEDAGYDLNVYPDPYIREAVFVAPKTYALKICHDDPPLVYHKVVCKGFEPSFKNAQDLHFQSMKELVWTRNNLKAYVNGKRDLEPDEADMTRRTFIRDSGRLQFASSMATNRVAPIQRTMTKQLTGVYTKGKSIASEPRLVQPYGIFDPPAETFLDFVNDTKHYD